MKIIEIDTDCNSEFLEVEPNVMTQLRTRLNGWPEVVHPKGLKPPFIMVVDEEGLLKNLPINLAGCFFYETHIHSQPIVGKVYIAKQAGNPLDGYDIGGLTDDDLAEFTSNYGCRITALKMLRKDGNGNL